MTNLLAISRFAHVTSRLTTGKRGQFVRIPYHGRNDYPQSILLSLFSVLTAWFSLYWNTGKSREITPCYSLQKSNVSIPYFSVFVKSAGRNSTPALEAGVFLLTFDKYHLTICISEVNGSYHDTVIFSDYRLSVYWKYDGKTC